MDFHELVLSDPAITGRVPRAKIERAFDLRRQLKNIDKIFARVFPKTKSKKSHGRSVRKKNSKKETQ